MCGIVVLAADDAAAAEAALEPFLPPLRRRGPDALGHVAVAATPAPFGGPPSPLSLLLASSLLQVRGGGGAPEAGGGPPARPTACPLVAPLPPPPPPPPPPGATAADSDAPTPAQAAPAAAASSASAQAVVLCFNGEIYEASPPALIPGLRPGASDGEALLGALSRCGTERQVAAALSALRGPWALALWHPPSRRLFFGRDVFGRRSLLALRRRGGLGGRREGTGGGKGGGGWAARVRFALASVAPNESAPPPGDDDGEEEEGDADRWEEVPPGVWSVGFGGGSDVDAEGEGPLDGGGERPWARAHPWTDPLLERLRRYERGSGGSGNGGGGDGLPVALASPPPPRGPDEPPCPPEARLVLELLLRAVARCCCGTIDRWHAQYPPPDLSSSPSFSPSSPPPPSPPPPLPLLLSPPSPVLTLFSGGVDSVLLAAAAHRAFPPDVPLDLCNVCFDPQRRSPDRLAALDALRALRRWAPRRLWRLLLVDGTLADADAASPRLRALMRPCATVMDLNIGAALWMAARGLGWLYNEDDDDDGVEEGGQKAEEEEKGSASAAASAAPRIVASAARCVLLGHGADEQHGGYGRHRTAWRSGGDRPADRLRALSDELALDARRMWRRNLGRDDRLVADAGREARHPYLDELFSAGACLDLPVGTLVAHEDEVTKSATGGGGSLAALPADKRLLRLALLLLGAQGGEGAVAAAAPTAALTLASLLSPDNPFASTARRDKRAIQFGTRLGKLCNVRDFGSNRRANARSAGSVALSCLDGEREKKN